MSLFKFDKVTREFSKCENTSYAKNKIMELHDIEEWVLKNPQLLLEELLPVTKEYDNFDKTNERLDILAIDKNKKLVVIELKRDDSGKDVALQAIKYAAYCSTLTFEDVVSLRQKFLSSQGENISIEEIEVEIRNFVKDPEFSYFDNSPRIIIVASKFRPEVTSTVYWLITQFNMDISCISISPYSIDENIGVVSQVILPIPEAKEFMMSHGKKEQSIQQGKNKAINWTMDRLTKELLQITDTTLRERLRIIMDMAHEKNKISLCSSTTANFRIVSSAGKIIFRFYFNGAVTSQVGKESVENYKSEDSMDYVINQLKDVSLLKADFDKDKQLWEKTLESGLGSMSERQFKSLINLLGKLMIEEIK